MIYLFHCVCLLSELVNSVFLLCISYLFHCMCICMFAMRVSLQCISMDSGADGTR